MAASLTDLTRALHGLRYPQAAIDGDLPAMLVMTDDDRLPDPSAVLDRLPRGAALIVRRSDASVREAVLRAVIAPCRRRGIRVLVAADAGLAYRLGADGVHLPEAALRAQPHRPFPERPSWLVTAAAHSPAALRRAAAAGVDAALVSPVFGTRSHPGARVLGTLRFTALARDAGVPVYALGGVNLAALRRLRHAGAAGVAGISMAGN